MEREPGLWGLQGVRVVAGSDGKEHLAQSGRGLAVTAYSCPICGLMRIYGIREGENEHG